MMQSPSSANEERAVLDCIIIGGSYAGLSAALILGRCCRDVLICDDGNPRNKVSRAMHGFLTRDGIDPAESLRIAREQLSVYETVKSIDGTVIDIKVEEKQFTVELRDGSKYISKTVLLATGIVDKLPPFAGTLECYGKSLWHCPYCDGWEVRGQPIATYGEGALGPGLALEMLTWSSDILLLCDGEPLKKSHEELLLKKGIKIRHEKVRELIHEDGILKTIAFESGPDESRNALFFHAPKEQHSELANKLGLEKWSEDSISTRRYKMATSIPGIYAAGDASKGVKLAIIAAAEGALAAFDINTQLAGDENY